MRTKTHLGFLLLLASSGSVLVAAPLGTAFTYQGKLTDGGQSANGTYDLRFTLYNVAGGGSTVAGPVTKSAVGVANGLFTAALDFGERVLSGEARGLEIGVRTNGNGAFGTFPARQQITPAPSALYAPNADAAVTAFSMTANGVSNPRLQTNAITTD